MIKDYKDLPRVYLDLDGPVADFLKVMTERNMSGSDLKLIPGVYRELPVINGAREAIRILAGMGYEVWILSKIPDENPYSATEKILWLNQYFPEIGERIILSPDKGCIGTSRDILIDDHPEWANAHNFKGRVIKFERDSVDVNTLNVWNSVLNEVPRLQ